jgi:hypothetical protein
MVARTRWITEIALVEMIRCLAVIWIYFPSSSGTKVIGESGKGFGMESDFQQQ